MARALVCRLELSTDAVEVADSAVRIVRCHCASNQVHGTEDSSVFCGGARLGLATPSAVNAAARPVARSAGITIAFGVPVTLRDSAYRALGDSARAVLSGTRPERGRRLLVALRVGTLVLLAALLSPLRLPTGTVQALRQTAELLRLQRRWRVAATRQLLSQEVLPALDAHQLGVLAGAWRLSTTIPSVSAAAVVVRVIGRRHWAVPMEADLAIARVAVLAE